MNWLDDYKSKLQTPAEAVARIQSGDRVYYAGNAAIPQALVRALAEFATGEEFLYSHKWRNGDLVVWDNRCTMHRATPFDQKYRRYMRRTQVRGDKPIPARASG